MSAPRKISETTFTVIDLETTGGVKPEHSITEISAIKVRGGEVIGEFTTLVNPQIPISYFISQYTGITNEMVKSAPVIREVLPQLLDFIGESVFVAHNAQFDLGFVNMELQRHGHAPLPNASLCTVRLARRLVPKNQKKNLGDLAASFGIEIHNRHRAKGDCEATVLVLAELLKLAATELGTETQIENAADDLEALLSLQYKSIRTFKPEPRHIKKIRKDTLDHLPQRAGVYLMKSAKGEVLYIGKSKNLRARVRSYFAGGEGHTEKLLELVAQVRKVDFQLTGSELEALILESRLIKLMRPHFNTMLKRYKSYPFLRLTAHAFPRLEIATEVLSDGSEYFGPFSSREVCEDVFDILNKNFQLRECDDHKLLAGQACIYYDLRRCTAPCEPSRDSETDRRTKYDAALQQVRDFLSGQDGSLLKMITEKMRALAAEQKFEEASLMKSKLGSLKRVFYRQASITASVNENNLLVLLPSENFSETTKEFSVFFVRFGRLVLQKKILADDVLTLQLDIADVFFSGATMPEECKKEEIDEMQILSSWIYYNRASLACLYIRGNTARDVPGQNQPTQTDATHSEPARQELVSPEPNISTQTTSVMASRPLPDVMDELLSRVLAMCTATSLESESSEPAAEANTANA
ncbi:MAG: DEDD exonuclease domain-containing protein [Rhizobacter sp.]|nr:DEDD exonuclease domain-containing protein [Chlorobiales bacterium]